MKKKLNAILSEDLEKILEKFSLKHDFNIGKLKCKFCGEVINKTNLYSLYPDSGSIKLVCNNHKCIDLFYRYLEEKKYGTT